MNKINIKYHLQDAYDFANLEVIQHLSVNHNILKYSQIYVNIMNINNKMNVFEYVLLKKKTNNKKQHQKYREKILKIKNSIKKDNLLLNNFFEENQDKLLFLSDFIIFVGIIWFKKYFIIDLHEVHLIELVTSYHLMINHKNKIDEFATPEVDNIEKYKNNVSEDLLLKIYSRTAFLISYYLKYSKEQNNKLKNNILLIRKIWYNYRLKNIQKFSYFREKNSRLQLERSLAIQSYNLKFKPNIEDRQIALLHYNNFYAIEKFIFNCIDDKYKYYAAKRICPIHTNWTIDITLWFGLIFIISKNSFPNITNLKILTEYCLKYALYNDMMAENNKFFSFYRPLTDYKDYYYMVDNKKYYIETNFDKIAKTSLFRQRFVLIQNTESLLFRFNFNEFFKKNKENEHNRRNNTIQNYYDTWEKKRVKCSKDLKKRNNRKNRKKKKNKIYINNNITEEDADKNAQKLIDELEKEEKKKNSKKKKIELRKKKKYMRINSCIIIQKYIRCFLNFKKYKLKKKLIISFQKYIRYYLEKKKFFIKKKSILLIQSYFRMYNVIKKVNKIKLDFIEEQKNKYQKQIEKLNIMQEKIINKKKNKYALKIQTFWRLYYIKNKYLEKHIISLKKKEIISIKKEIESLVEKLKNINNKYDNMLKIPKNFCMKDKYKKNNKYLKKDKHSSYDSLSSNSTIDGNF